MKTLVALSLGSNIGNRLHFIELMRAELEKVLDPPFATSSLMETEPVGMPNCSDLFLNQIISGYYNKEVIDLLHESQTIEYKLGRIREQPLMPRTADIDILLFGNLQCIQSKLIVPHPAITRRLFCLMGLAQILPEIIVAKLGKTTTQLLSEADQSVQNQRVTIL